VKLSHRMAAGDNGQKNRISGRTRSPSVFINTLS
jgi:hypothetical protein